MNQRKKILILLGLWFSAFNGICQIDTSSLNIKIWKKQLAPKIVPIISDRGELIKLTASGCINGEIIWFDSKKRILANGELITKNIVDRVGAVCQSKEKCPSDTAFFEIDFAFQGKAVKMEESKKVCVGTELTYLVEGCEGKIFWQDGFLQTDQRKLLITKADTIKYQYRCLQSNGISKFVSIELPVLKPTLDSLVLYPNPTFNWLKLQSKTCLNGVKYQIYSIIGQKIHEAWAESNDDILQINVSDLPSEEYIVILSLAATDERVTKRFIKLSKP